MAALAAPTCASRRMARSVRGERSSARLDLSSPPCACTRTRTRARARARGAGRRPASRAFGRLPPIPADRDAGRDAGDGAGRGARGGELGADRRAQKAFRARNGFRARLRRERPAAAAAHGADLPRQRPQAARLPRQHSRRGVRRGRQKHRPQAVRCAAPPTAPPTAPPAPRRPLPPQLLHRLWACTA